MREVPVPRQIRAVLGHSNAGVSDEARGFELPDDWVEELCHGSLLNFCDSISSQGLIPGGLAGHAGRANYCFSALDWRSFGKHEDYNYGNLPFTGPE